VLGGLVVEAAPIMQRFIGQSIVNVEQWSRAQGGSCTSHESKPTQALLPF